MVDLVGKWDLVSMEIRDSNDEVSYPFGKDLIGTLSYSAGGAMSAQVMRRDRPSFASGDIQAATDEEIRAAYMGCISYFGTYTLDESEKSVAHNVEGSLFPNWVGESQMRYYDLDGDTLSLRTQPIDVGGKSIVAYLILKRAE